MSALPPKADMFSVEIDVCFVPEPDSDTRLAVRLRIRRRALPDRGRHARSRDRSAGT